MLDWRNWRRRIYMPAAAAIEIDGGRPYDLRHSFASLLIHENRLSIIEIAAQLGHNPNVCLSTYAHVMADLDDARGVSAEDQIRAARAARDPKNSATAPDFCGPNAAHERRSAATATPNNDETPDDIGGFNEALCRTRTGDPFLTMEVLYQLS